MLAIGLLLLAHSHGGLGAVAGTLALCGGASYALGMAVVGQVGLSLRLAGAALMVVALAIPSTLTLLFPLAALLATRVALPRRPRQAAQSDAG
jgi:hypothetical protein